MGTPMRAQQTTLRLQNGNVYEGSAGFLMKMEEDLHLICALLVASVLKCDDT